jgi:DNA polymerase alpha subunit B
VDILKNLSGEEMSRNPTDGTPIDRMSRLANHVLCQQRHVVVIFPLKGTCSLDIMGVYEKLYITINII